MKDPSISRSRKHKIKLVCSFNGKFLPRPPTGKLRYTGGETRIISVDRNIGFARLNFKILELIHCPNKRLLPFSLLYQVSDSETTDEQSPMGLIASDDDVRCMIDAYENLELYGTHSRLWTFVCYDNGFGNLGENVNGFTNFAGNVSLISGLGIVCKKINVYDDDKNMNYVKNDTLSLCGNGFVNQNSLIHCGGAFGRDKVKKLLPSGDKPKVGEDSLRKMVLKQQLAKQSTRIQSSRCGLGLVIEQAEMETAGCENENCDQAFIGLSSEIEVPLSCGSANPSFVGGAYRFSALDYKYNNTNSVQINNFANLAPLSVSHFCPLNPKYANPRVELNGSYLSLGSTCGINTSNPNHSIVVSSFPKPNSVMCCYDAKCKSKIVEPASYSDIDRENIMPWAEDPMTLRAGLVPLSCGNQLFGGLYRTRSSYGSSHGGIRNHRFGSGDGRNQRIYPYHHRNNRGNPSEMGNYRNVKLDGRPWVGKFYPGLRSTSSISKQGQFMRSYYPTFLKPWSNSHNQKLEGDATPTEYILNNKACSLSLLYGSQEDLSKQGELGVPLGKRPNTDECHLSYYDQLPDKIDHSLLPPIDPENLSRSTKEMNTQIDHLTAHGPVEHKFINQQDLANVADFPNKLGLECNAKLLEIGAGCESQSKHQNDAHTLQASIPSSVDFPLHNLSLLSFDDSEPPRPSGSSNSSDAALQPHAKAIDLMDEERLSSGCQVQNSFGLASFSSSDKAMEVHGDIGQEAENPRDPESTLTIENKQDIKKMHEGCKVNGEIPTQFSAAYTHLATRELQTIRNSDLEYVKELGSGTYGTVFYGKWKGSDVAIKRLKASCFDGGAVEENRLVADFWKEAHILGQLHHPNIVALYGVVTDGPVTDLATVTEYMVNGSLKQVLRRKDRTIDRRKRLIIAMDAAFGMEYLHEKGIVHFDLKSHNFLVNMRDLQRPVCKIGDLGLSKIKQKTLVSGGVRGTIPWMAPELLNSKNLVTEKVDVYSFGIVMWELLTGEEPYVNMRSHEIIAGIIKCTLRPETPSWCDPAWRSLMEKCWSSDPDARPTFSEIAKELRTMAAAMNIK